MVHESPFGERIDRVPARAVDETQFPRRNRVDQWTPAERVIQDAVDAVEMAGADVRLTDAVVLLGYARESVADFVDGVERRRLARVTDGLDVPASLSSSGSPASPLSDEERAFIEHTLTELRDDDDSAGCQFTARATRQLIALFERLATGPTDG